LCVIFPFEAAFWYRLESTLLRLKLLLDIYPHTPLPSGWGNVPPDPDKRRSLRQPASEPPCDDCSPRDPPPTFPPDIQKRTDGGLDGGVEGGTDGGVDGGAGGYGYYPYKLKDIIKRAISYEMLPYQPPEPELQAPKHIDRRTEVPWPCPGPDCLCPECIPDPGGPGRPSIERRDPAPYRYYGYPIIPPAPAGDGGVDGGTDGGTKQIQRRGEGTPALPEKRQYPSHPYEYPDPTPVGDGGVDSGTDGGTKHIQRRGASPQVDKRQAPTGAYDYVDTPAGPKALHTPGPFIQRRDSEEPPTHYPYRVPDGPQKRSAEPLELGPHEPSGTPPISYAYRVPDPVKRSAEPQVSEPVPGPLPKHYLYHMPEKRSAEPQVSDPNEPSDPHVRYWYHNPDKRSAEPQVPDPDEPLDPHRYLYRMPS
jgi:hypothetical protein